MSRDKFVAIVPSLFPNREHYYVLYPVVILLCHMNLIYPEDLVEIADELGGWRRSILIDCNDYLFLEDITAEDLVARIVSTSSLFGLFVSTYIRCCATVSKSKTEDLVREFVKKVHVELLFEVIHVWESYILGWMLSEDVVIRVGGKRLQDYDVTTLPDVAIKRRDYLIRMMNSEV